VVTEKKERPPLLGRSLTRRRLLGGTLAAGSFAVAYAALGDRLDLFGGGGESAALRGEAGALEDDSVKISHLLRRAGFGVTKEEHDRYQRLGFEATLAELLDFTSVADDEAVALAEQLPVGEGRIVNPAPWWLVRMANTKRPLQEKLTFFWHGLLTSQLSVVRDGNAMRAQNELLRTLGRASFPEILRAISTDPAMMVYLDTSGSRRNAPNENYARELMELFSMGEGNYGEDDVREAARAFTGWVVPRRRDQNVITLNEPLFRSRQFDAGSKTFLGRTGDFRPEDIIDIIVEQPASARYISQRLFSFFVYPGPDEETLAPFVAVYNESDRSIGAVVEALLRSDVFYSDRAYRAIVRSPVEYLISAVKALGLQVDIGQLLVGGRGPPRRDGGVLGAMGQVPFEPPNVAGWPGGADWLNSATIFARLNLLNDLTGATGRDRQGHSQAVGGLGTATQALDHYLPLVLDDNLPPEARSLFVEFAGGADRPLSPEQLRDLVYLILASPQFHLS